MPFIDIPVKKSLDYAKGAMVNLNVGALALAGVVFFVSVLVVPNVVSLLAHKLMFDNGKEEIKENGTMEMGHENRRCKYMTLILRNKNERQ